MASHTLDLHGIKGQPFPNFTEDATYLERVTIPRRTTATLCMAVDLGVNAEELELQPIHMRWVEEIDRDNEPELDNCEAPCWVECEADHPDAVPFWRDQL